LNSVESCARKPSRAADLCIGISRSFESSKGYP
jgi:hypothetical protein